MPKKKPPQKKKKAHKKIARWSGDKNAVAARLNLNMPESEKWFWREWESAGMKHEADAPNRVFLGFIPDVINRHYGYVIEVDGSIHERDRVKKWDARKNMALPRHGFAVFRLEAYNYEHFGMLVDEVTKIRERKDKAHK